MGKAKTSTKQKKSIKNIDRFSDCTEYNPTAEILNGDKVAKAIMECLLDNDPEGVIEVIHIYLDTVNMVKGPKKPSLVNAKMIQFLKNKNPTVKELAKIMSSVSA